MIKPYYHEELFSLEGFGRRDFLRVMPDWINNEKVTHYMVTGLYPANYQKLAEVYDHDLKEGNIVFAIRAGESKDIVGSTGLYRFDWQSRHAEFRIIIGDEGMWGKGIGSNVCKFLVQYGFERLNLNKIWLGVNEENKAAVKSYENAGFHHEGSLRQELFRNNKYYDILRMSILKEEYETQNKN